MLRPEPDKVTIDAWLAGNLPADQVEALESYLAENPRAAGDLDKETSGESLDEELFRELTPGEEDPSVQEMIARLKSGLFVEPFSPRDDSWREVLVPSDDPELLGTIGQYEVRGVIANGGMGILLRAWQPELKRIETLKVLSPGLAANGAARERFLREARAAARLEHDNILPIYGVHDEAVPYFAMRYVAGGTLQDRLDRGKVFSLEDLTFFARGVASALEAAHAHGIVHRDIKPANILLSGKGDRLWVCDFGIARCTEDPSLTYAGAIAGTPQFMSPEQAAGEELDERSDLFSLGLVLYRCATGEHRFSGTTSTAVLTKLGKGTAVSTRRGFNGLPDWFRQLMFQLLAHERDDRPRSASEVLRMLDSESASPPGSTRFRWSPAGWIGLAGIVLLAAALLAFLQFGGPSGSRNESAAQMIFPDFDHAGIIGIEGSDRQFVDLATAVDFAPEGSVLELSGNFALNGEVWAEKEIHLKAKPGKEATITALHANEHALFFFGPASLSGLRFVRPDSNAMSQPIVGIKSGSGEVVIEDCRFVSGSLEEGRNQHGQCLSLTDTDHAVVRRCIFDGGRGVFLATETSLDSRTSVVFEECIFLGHTAVEVRCRDDLGGIRVSASRCLAITDHFLYKHFRGPVPRLDLRVVDSVVHTEGSLILMLDAEKEVLVKRIGWTGEGNRYHLGAGWLESRAFHLQAKTFEPVFLESGGEFDALPDVSDVNRVVIDALPSGGAEDAPPSVGHLLELLNLPEDSPVRETLRKLAEPESSR